MSIAYLRHTSGDLEWLMQSKIMMVEEFSCPPPVLLGTLSFCCPYTSISSTNTHIPAHYNFNMGLPFFYLPNPTYLASLPFKRNGMDIREIGWVTELIVAVIIS